MALPLSLVPLDGDAVDLTANEVYHCGVLMRAGASEPGQRVPVGVEKEALLAWKRGLTDSTPASDVFAGMKV